MPSVNLREVTESMTPSSNKFKGLFVSKSIEKFKENAMKMDFRKTLTSRDVLLIGVGDIIGAGIFVITGKAAALYAGPAIILSFILSGIACAFAGLCYAEMAAAIPVSGSAYTFAYATMGEIVAWVIGWDLCLEYLMGASTVAVGWSAYFVSFLRVVGVPVSKALTSSPIEYSDARGIYVPDGGGGIMNLPAMAIVLVITLILCIGIKQSSWTNHVFVGIKVSVILLFLFSTYAYINPSNWQPFIPERTADGKYGFQGVLRASVTVFFAYIGFDAVSTTAQEAKNPGRGMPIGILGSLSLCTVLYIMVSLNLTGIKKYTELNTAAPLADAVSGLGMTWLSVLVSIGGVAGLSSVILVSLMAQPRVFSTMAADGLLPPVFGSIHPKFGTPFNATIFSGTVVMLCAGFLPMDLLSNMTSAGTLFAFLMVSVSVIVLRYKRPDLERPFKIPGGPILVPGLGAACALTLIVVSGGNTVIRLVVWMAVGFVVYAAYGYRHSKIRQDESAAVLPTNGGHFDDIEMTSTATATKQ